LHELIITLFVLKKIKRHVIFLFRLLCMSSSVVQTSNCQTGLLSSSSCLHMLKLSRILCRETFTYRSSFWWNRREREMLERSIRTILNIIHRCSVLQGQLNQNEMGFSYKILLNNARKQLSNPQHSTCVFFSDRSRATKMVDCLFSILGFWTSASLTCIVFCSLCFSAALVVLDGGRVLLSECRSSLKMPIKWRNSNLSLAGHSEARQAGHQPKQSQSQIEGPLHSTQHRAETNAGTFGGSYKR